MRQLLAAQTPVKVLVVGGGRQRPHLDLHLGAGNAVHVIYSDVDVRADVNLFCDGHDLPFRDDTFDAVVTTAVLEHVLYPEKVVGEIVRTLKDGGLLYSEMPFMQQVHEGAYDFTRYTLSGHRRLLNRFDEVECGMIAGPGTALVWAIENFWLAFFSGRTVRNIVKAVIRLTTFWLKYFDYLTANLPQAMDGASCTYFLGKKRNSAKTDLAIVEAYIGAGQMTHK